MDIHSGMDIHLYPFRNGYRKTLAASSRPAPASQLRQPDPVSQIPASSCQPALGQSPASSLPTAGQLSASSRPAPGQLPASSRPAPASQLRQIPSASSRPAPASSRQPAPRQFPARCQAPSQRPVSSRPAPGQLAASSWPAPGSAPGQLLASSRPLIPLWGPLWAHANSLMQAFKFPYGISCGRPYIPSNRSLKQIPYSLPYRISC